MINIKRENMNMRCFLLFFVLLTLFQFNAVFGADGPQAYTDKKQQDGITFELSVSNKELNIADTFTFTLRASCASDADTTVILPKLDAVLNDNDNFHVLDSVPPIVDSAKGVKLTAMEYRIEPLNTGELVFPELVLEYYTGKDKSKAPEVKTIKLNGPVFTVTDVVPADGTEALSEIKPQVELPRSYAWLIWVAIGVFLAIIALLVIVYLMSKRQFTAPALPQRPAHEIALERLNALIAENLLHAGRVKEFYEKLSYIIRLYIEHRYALKAPEMTTEEFLQEAARNGQLPDAFKDKLREFLLHCDMVKFAKYAPTADEIDRSVSLARNFIESTAALG